MNLKFVPFDIVSELDSDEAVAEYLRQVFTDAIFSAATRHLAATIPTAA